MNGASDRFAKSLIGGLFYPTQLPMQILSRPVLHTLILILLLTPILALPPIREVMRHAMAIHCLDEHTKEVGKQYSDFAIILFQMLIALTVGGIFITEELVKSLQARMAQTQALMDATFVQKRRRMMAKMYRTYVRVKRLWRGVAWRNVVQRFMDACNSLFELFSLVNKELPVTYAYMLAFRAASAFPGGLYGVMAFVFFECLLLSTVAKTYFDYLIVCEPSQLHGPQ
jgi:hypothetical protein